MVVGVISYLVSLNHHALNQMGVKRDLLPDKEKSRRNSKTLQKIEKLRGARPMRAVIEGQGDIAKQRVAADDLEEFDTAFALGIILCLDFDKMTVAFFKTLITAVGRWAGGRGKRRFTHGWKRGGTDANCKAVNG